MNWKLFSDEIHLPINAYLNQIDLDLYSVSPGVDGVIYCAIIKDHNERDFDTLYEMYFDQSSVTFDMVMEEIQKFLEAWNSPLAKAMSEQD